MLRLVVDEAERSEEGIDNAEGRMIKAVLDMQDTEVGGCVRLSVRSFVRLSVLTFYLSVSLNAEIILNIFSGIVLCAVSPASCYY